MCSGILCRRGDCLRRGAYVVVNRKDLRESRMNRRMKQAVVAGLMLTGLGVVGAGCLSRPVEHTDPKLKTNFTAVVENKSIDKVDILFDIDNSASMGDKQDYLKAAIPDL